MLKIFKRIISSKKIKSIEVDKLPQKEEKQLNDYDRLMYERFIYIGKTLGEKENR